MSAAIQMSPPHISENNTPRLEIVRFEREPELRIRIEYREPGYELRTGVERVYSWTYRIEATSEEAAKAAAVAEFKHMADLSSAGWVREIVGIKVIP